MFIGTVNPSWRVPFEFHCENHVFKGWWKLNYEASHQVTLSWSFFYLVSWDRRRYLNILTLCFVVVLEINPLKIHPSSLLYRHVSTEYSGTTLTCLWPGSYFQIQCDLGSQWLICWGLLKCLWRFLLFKVHHVQFCYWYAIGHHVSSWKKICSPFVFLAFSVCHMPISSCLGLPLCCFPLLTLCKGK